MDNEAYREIGHDEAADMLATELRSQGYMVKREQALPSGKVADLMVMTPDGMLSIVEVKLVYKSSLIAEAWHKYAAWCHELWFAVPDLMSARIAADDVVVAFADISDKVGIISVRRDGITGMRAPKLRPMPQLDYTLTRCLFESP